MSLILASGAELGEASTKIREFVDGHGPKPYSNGFGEFLVYQAELEVPRTIGQFEAHFLRLFKGVSGNILAGASYSKLGLEPHPVTDVAQEMPLRHVVIRDGAPATFTFNGTMSALEHPLPKSMLDELVADVSTAH